MIFLLYTWNKKTIEIGKLHCDTITQIPGKGCDIFRNRIMNVLYQPAKVISRRCLMQFIRFHLLHQMAKKKKP